VAKKGQDREDGMGDISSSMTLTGVVQSTLHPRPTAMRHSAAAVTPASPAGDTVDLGAAGDFILTRKALLQPEDFTHGEPVVEKAWEITLAEPDPGETIIDHYRRDNWYMSAGAPVLAGNGTVVAAQGKELTGYDKETGDVAWRFQCKDTISTRPLVSDEGTLYAASDDGKLYAVDSVTGEKKWAKKWNLMLHSAGNWLVDSMKYAGGIQSFNDRSTFQALSMGPDGTIYGSSNHRVFAFSPEGKRKFDRSMGDFVISTPAAGPSGLVHVVVSRPDERGHQARYLTGNNGQTGDEVWAHRLWGELNSPVITVDRDGSVLVSTEFGTVCCRGDNGESFFSYGDPTTVPPRIGRDGTHYVPGGKGRFLWVGPKNEKAWAASFKDGIAAAPVEGPCGTLIAVGREGSGQVLAKKDGKVLASFTCDRGALGAIEMTENGTLIVSDGKGISAYTVPYVRNNLLERAVKEAAQAPESEVAMEGNFIEIDGFKLPIRMAHMGRGTAVVEQALHC
jgi:hypothetical protein